MLTDDQIVNLYTRYYAIVTDPDLDQRRGQALMNALFDVRPDLYDALHGTDADCFYSDKRIVNFMEVLGI